MLPSTKEVETVYLQSGGILDALKSLSRPDVEQTVVIDSTTLAVESAQKVAAQVQNTGAQMVDAPVSGGTFCFVLDPLSHKRSSLTDNR
jgi:3-hydroxyisobutyrate dehydrogenase